MLYTLEQSMSLKHVSAHSGNFMYKSKSVFPFATFTQFILRSFDRISEQVVREGIITMFCKDTSTVFICYVLLTQEQFSFIEQTSCHTLDIAFRCMALTRNCSCVVYQQCASSLHYTLIQCMLLAGLHNS